MKKVGKTTRPFRYELNQIPYDYTVEVRNRFKGLDLMDRVPDKIWTGIGEFNSDDHYIYYCGQESLVHSQQKQDWELTVAQIMKSLLPNLDLN